MRMILHADGRPPKGSALVMHNERMADPLEPIVREIAQITKKGVKKTEADHEEIGRLEFVGGMYENANGPCIPAWNVLRCLQDGARRIKRGLDVPRGIIPLVETADLEYEGPRAIDVLWKEGGFSLRKTVGIQRSRTMRTRPIFVDWQLEVPIEVDSNVWDLDTLRHCWEEAGKYAGLGEMRPVYGRFEGTITEEAE